MYVKLFSKRCSLMTLIKTSIKNNKFDVTHEFSTSPNDFISMQTCKVPLVNYFRNKLKLETEFH